MTTEATEPYSWVIDSHKFWVLWGLYLKVDAIESILVDPSGPSVMIKMLSGATYTWNEKNRGAEVIKFIDSRVGC